MIKQPQCGRNPNALSALSEFGERLSRHKDPGMGSLVCRQLVDSINSLVDYPTSGARHRDAWGLESVAWKSIRFVA